VLKVVVPEVTLYRLPFSVPVPLVPDSVKPSESDKEVRASKMVRPPGKNPEKVPLQQYLLSENKPIEYPEEKNRIGSEVAVIQAR
jgi:hypothetical protein